MSCHCTPPRITELLERNNALLEKSRAWEMESNQEYAEKLLLRNEVMRLREVVCTLGAFIEECHANSGDPMPDEIAACVEALFPPEPDGDSPRGSTLEDRTAQWVETRMGADHLKPQERALRVLEEAAELAQAEGIAWGQSLSMVAHVYSRPQGEPSLEGAGLAITLFGWCASRGLSLMHLALTELARIEAKPVEEIEASLARKADAGVLSEIAQ